MDFPAPPEPHAIAVMVLTVVALLLFMREKIPLETSSMVVIAALALGFELFPYRVDDRTLRAVDFFHGFGHEALIAVCALMIVGQGMVRTGALEPLGGLLARRWGERPALSMMLMLLIAAALSAFVNNTPIVVLLMPVLTSVALRTRTAPSKLLMPMGLATLIGGTATTIGTSTNLLVVSVAADMGLRRIGMFDFIAPAALAGLIGIAFLWLVAPRLLPKRETPLSDASPRIFTAHLRVREDGFANGRTLSEVVAKTGGSMKVLRIERGPGLYVTTFPDTRLKAGDRLLVTDTPRNLKQFEQALGATLYSGDTKVDEEHPLTAEDQQISEIVVVHGSPIEGVTLKDVRFIDRYQLVVLALHRAGKARASLGAGMGDVVLEAGDQVLVLDATTDLPHTRKAPTAMVIMTAVILTAALGLLPISVAAVLGVLLMVATRCLNWREAAMALNAQVVLIVVASLGLGLALLETGAAGYIARVFVAATFGASPLMVLGSLILLMGLLTNVVSSNAAAVIGTPIAVSIAEQIGQSPEPFVLAVIFGANLCYATPLAHKINVLVMSAGGYTFADFVRVGVPLAFVMWLSYTMLLGLLYGL